MRIISSMVQHVLPLTESHFGQLYSGLLLSAQTSYMFVALATDCTMPVRCHIIDHMIIKSLHFARLTGEHWQWKLLFMTHD